MNIYREADGTYLLVLAANGLSAGGMYDCVGELRLPGNSEAPVLASSQVSPDYLRTCKPVAAGDLPEVWRRAFAPYLEVSH